METTVNTNPTAPADFKIFLATQKGVFSSSDVKEFQKFKEEYDRVSADRFNYTRDAALNYSREIGRRASEDPSVENLDALKKHSPQEVESRYENISTELCRVQEALLRRARPLLAKLRDAVLPIVGAQIEKVEAENRARFESLGVSYDPAADVLLLSLKRWRDVVSAQFSGERVSVHPSQVTGRLGPIRGKAGLLG